MRPLARLSPRSCEAPRRCRRIALAARLAVPRLDELVDALLEDYAVVTALVEELESAPPQAR